MTLTLRTGGLGAQVRVHRLHDRLQRQAGGRGEQIHAPSSCAGDARTCRNPGSNLRGYWNTESMTFEEAKGDQ